MHSMFLSQLMYCSKKGNKLFRRAGAITEGLNSVIKSLVVIQIVLANKSRGWKER